jgi:hypothetical protein
LLAEAGEGFERGAERALGGRDAALQPLEDLLLVPEGGGQRILLGFLTPLAKVRGALVDGPIPDLRLGFAEATQKPIGGDSVIDEGDLFGALRLVTVVIPGGEALEGVGIFAGDDLGLGINARLQSIHAADGFPFGGSGSGR